MPRIAVIGSSNTDMTVSVERLPAPGETVIGKAFSMAAGGKGANQAVAAARLGARVAFIACLGQDQFGDRALEAFRREGIDTSGIARSARASSGVALIFVDSRGENVIAVAPGANALLAPEHVHAAAGLIRSADVVLAQLEVPLEAVEAAAEAAREAGATFLLNPAPARDLPAGLLSRTAVLTPNETEAALLAGIGAGSAPPEEVARMLLGRGAQAVVMTLGARGALAVTAQSADFIPAPQVKAVDTTAAGDCFSAALAVGVAEGMTLVDAARFAARAAAISVTRAGAQPSLPTREEVDASGG